MWVNIQRIIGVSHCANVVWLDLGGVTIGDPLGGLELVFFVSVKITSESLKRVLRNAIFKIAVY
jgi:hypothetical protein